MILQDNYRIPDPNDRADQVDRFDNGVPLPVRID
jgi:hypothetical protein